MTTIVTRSGKGSPLTNAEVDANFTNLNTDKLDLTGGTLTGPLIVNEPTAVTMSAGTTAQRLKATQQNGVKQVVVVVVLTYCLILLPETAVT